MKPSGLIRVAADLPFVGIMNRVSEITNVHAVPA